MVFYELNRPQHKCHCCYHNNYYRTGSSTCLQNCVWYHKIKRTNNTIQYNTIQYVVSLVPSLQRKRNG